MSVREVFALSDEAAFDLFREVRWGKGKEVVCAECGVAERHWFLPSRRQWRCKACGHTFSVTSGRIFAHHKLPLRVYLGAVALYTNAVKGLSALQLCRDLGLQYKTAFVLMHKVRERLMVQREETPLAGQVETDGAYVGGHVRRRARRPGAAIGDWPRTRAPTSVASWSCGRITPRSRAPQRPSVRGAA